MPPCGKVKIQLEIEEIVAAQKSITIEINKGNTMDRITKITNCISSQRLATLWLFYRDVFTTDEECLQFLCDTLRGETDVTKIKNIITEDCEILYVDEKGKEIQDTVFIPRRMLNAVERMVTAARDMEIIRCGKDVFKVVYLVTCAETLLKLAGKDKNEKGRDISKKDMLFSLFEQHTSAEDKKYIADRFAHDDEEIVDERQDSFRQFVGVINEYRNCAAHEGEYWEYCFNNNHDGYPVPLVVKVDLKNFSGKNEKKKEHCFTTEISYSEFEKIFVRTCINFISDYVLSLHKPN